MLKKTIKYIDPLTGTEMEDDAYFNLTKAECIEINIRDDLAVVSRGRNNNEIMDAFKRVLKASYGVRTADGKFVKPEQEFLNFMASEAYSELFMEIFQNPAYAAEFIRAILPAEIQLEEGLTNSQGNVPPGMKSHPSMQGYKAPQAAQQTRDESRSTDWDAANPQTQTPEERAAGDVEYQEYLAAKAAKEKRQAEYDASHAATPPAQVSPEVPQASSPPREELI